MGKFDTGFNSRLGLYLRKYGNDLAILHHAHATTAHDMLRGAFSKHSNVHATYTLPVIHHNTESQSPPPPRQRRAKENTQVLTFIIWGQINIHFIKLLPLKHTQSNDGHTNSKERKRFWDAPKAFYKEPKAFFMYFTCSTLKIWRELNIHFVKMFPPRAYSK